MELDAKLWFRTKLATAAVLISAAALAFAVSAGIAPCRSVFAQSTSCNVGDAETFSGPITLQDEVNVGATPGPGNAGQILESQGADASPEWVFFDITAKSADEIVNNSTTLQNDDHLTFTAEANGVYKIDAVILYLTTAAADSKFQFTLPSGTIDGQVTYTTSVNPTTTFFTEASSTTVSDNKATDTVLEITAVVKIGVTGGDVHLQWAQNTMDASNTTWYSGSSMEVRKAS